LHRTEASNVGDTNPIRFSCWRRAVASTPAAQSQQQQQPQGAATPFDNLAAPNAELSRPEPATPQVTKATNPKLAAALAQKDASPAAGAVALAAPVALAAAPVAASELGATAARLLTPIAKKYGIKALEGAGLGMGYKLDKELEGLFGK
jgi:hypothetical protein